LGVKSIPAAAGREIMPSLTGLRFLLASLVTMYHLAGGQMKHAPRWMGSITSFGCIAVNAFFILSGFVLAHGYIDASGKLRGTRGDFWVARLARIYPVYVLAIVLSFPHRFDHGQSSLTGWGDILGSLAVFTMMQAWVPSLALFINSAAWSLSAELVFYICFPTLIRLVAGRTKTRLMGVILVCWILLLTPASLLLLITSGAMGPSAAAFISTEQWSAFILYNPLLRVPAFVMGIATQRLFFLWRSSRFVNSWRSVALACGSLAAIGVILGAGLPIPRPLAQNGLLAPGFAALIFGLAPGRGALAAILGHPVFVKLGEASYSLYLLHLPVWGLSLAINALTFRFAESSWTFLIADLVLTVGVSLAALTFVETPYRKSVSAGLRAWMQKVKPLPAYPSGSRESPAVLSARSQTFSSSGGDC
jgi:peptidoglycan/LPS O-acetylase OafA/YrhL